MQMIPVMQTVSNKNGKLIIRLQDVVRIYKVGVERIHALDGINLELRENEYVAVMGASGSGKSTLMNVLGCLDRATSGSYERWLTFATSESALSFSRLSCLDS
jgi:ABC-type lipoprotein export system ATPase subunit